MTAGAMHRNNWSLANVSPATVTGPFYPVVNRHAGTDLVRPGARALGQALVVSGRVLDANGRPAAGVLVEIWQANSRGRYDHPSDGNPAPLDPNFIGSGAVMTDDQGRYRFRTVVPGEYEVVPGWLRAPHIHFQVTGRCDRHVTQMWFPGHPLNAQDRLWLAFAPADQERVCARILSPGDGARECVAAFDIVVPNG